MKLDKIINWTFFLAFIVIFFIGLGATIFAAVQTEYTASLIMLIITIAVAFPMVLITYQDVRS